MSQQPSLFLFGTSLRSDSGQHETEQSVYNKVGTPILKVLTVTNNYIEYL